MAPHRRYLFYCQHVLPLVYDESLSYYETLCKLGEYIKELSEDVNSLENLAATLQLDVTSLKNEFISHKNANDVEFAKVRQEMLEDYDELQAQITALKNAGITPQMEAYLKAYIEQNLQGYVSDIVKYVIFGLDNTGHFVAYIPETWQFINFGTIEDYESPLFGHLTLAW